MRAHWQLSLGRATCGFPRLPSWCMQSKSGDLYLALQMVHYGLCLGALQFRLHCVLLHEGGHWIMKSQPFRWEAGSRLVLRFVFKATALPLRIFFPTWLASTLSHGHTLSGEKVFMVSHISPILPQEVVGYSGSPEKHQRGHTCVGLTVALRVTWDLLYTHSSSRGQLASLDISLIISPACCDFKQYHGCTCFRGKEWWG